MRLRGTVTPRCALRGLLSCPVAGRRGELPALLTAFVHLFTHPIKINTDDTSTCYGVYYANSAVIVLLTPVLQRAPSAFARLWKTFCPSATLPILWGIFCSFLGGRGCAGGVAKGGRWSRRPVVTITCLICLPGWGISSPLPGTKQGVGLVRAISQGELQQEAACSGDVGFGAATNDFCFLVVVQYKDYFSNSPNDLLYFHRPFLTQLAYIFKQALKWIEKTFICEIVVSSIWNTRKIS